MVKILLVDDVEDNNLVLELIVEDYMKENNISIDDYTISVALNGQEAIDMIVDDGNYDILFLDIMMPIKNGLDTLKEIRKLELKFQPVIIMVSALDDDVTIKKEKELGANAFANKPFEKSTIEMMLNHYISKIIQNHQLDEGLDFEDDFFDFDEEFEDDIEHNTNDMDNYNASHKKISAAEFLSTFGDDEVHLEDLSELEEGLDQVIANIIQNGNLETERTEVIVILNQYRRFLFLFSEFEELSAVISNIVTLITDINFDKLKNKKNVSNFIVSIIDDLIKWKEHVFVVQDAIDVYYINASILNSSIGLKNLIEK
jgi:CheY-like chemotaxis protein